MIFGKGNWWDSLLSDMLPWLSRISDQYNVRSVQAFEQELNLEALDVGLQSDCCAKSLRLCVHTQFIILYVLPRSNLVALSRGQEDWMRMYLW